MNEAAGQIVRVSVATDGTLANDSSLVPSLSQDGRFVAFLSFASNLAPGDTNGVADIFLRDRDTDGDGVFDEPGAVSTIRVSQLETVQANGPSFHPVVTPDGRYVFFESAATNFYSVGQPPLSFTEILRWDRLSGAIVLVSRNDAGEPLNARSFWPAPTDDGNVVYFVTAANNGPGAAAGGALIRRDIAAGLSTAVAVGTDGTIDRPSVSGDGRVLAYTVPSGESHWRHASSSRPGANRIVCSQARSAQVSHDGAFLSGIQYTGDSGGPAFRIHLRSGERRQVGDDQPVQRERPPARRRRDVSCRAPGRSSATSSTDRGRRTFFPHGGSVAFDSLDQWLVYRHARRCRLIRRSRTLFAAA